MISDPSMTGSKALRLLTILILYVAQGIPIGLLEFAIPAWMAANGATGAEIGYMIGMGGLPWSLKFINGALIDRYTYLAMGRRRAWLIGAQVVMVLALLACALLMPGPRDYILLGAISFTVMAAVVFQDVAADALAVDIARADERGMTGGLMSGGQALGIAISAALAGTVIYFFGIGAAYVGCAATMALVTAYLIWLREREGEKRLPWSVGQPHPRSLTQQAEGWWPMVRHAFAHLLRPDSLKWVLPLFLKGLGYGTMTVVVPLIAANYAGWNEAQLGYANGIGQLAAAFGAMTIGAYLTTKLGAKPFQIISLLCFAAIIVVFAALESQWSQAWMIYFIVIGWTVIYFIVSAPQAAMTMTFCHPKTGATQFSIYMAVTNQGISFAGFTFAFFEGFGGLTGVLVMLAAATTLAAVFVTTIRLPDSGTEDGPADAGALPA